MTAFKIIAGAAVAAGVVWMFLTGSVWQFVPIAAAIGVGLLVGKLLKEEP